MTETIIVALIGFIGVVIGAIIQIVAKYAEQYFEQRNKEKTDIKRKELLTTMLEYENISWRKLETLSHVIGADKETTKRLLLEIGARGSEDGQELWGLISRNPFNKQLKN